MQSQQRRQTTVTHWSWIGVALAAHTAWGAYPVLARYLQTVSNLPSMALLAAGNTLALAVAVAIFLPRLDKRVFRRRILWLFALIVVARGITNFLAARYTLSIYVQLITQMTPFLVALLSTTLLREQLPPYTGRAMTLCLLGAVLMIGGNIELAGMGASRTDWLGIGLALFSALALATYMLLVRRSADTAVTGEALFLMQPFSIGLFSLATSLFLGENWGAFAGAETADWFIFATYVGGVLIGASLGQIGALRRLGAPMVSSLLAWRLVSALIVGALLLNERLTSWRQVMGAGIVLVTITWYLWQQRQD